MKDKIKSELLEWVYPEGSHERAAWINGDKNEADFILDGIIKSRKASFEIYSRALLGTNTGAVFYCWRDERIDNELSRQWRWGEGWDINEREAYIKAFEWAYRHIFGKFPE